MTPPIARRTLLRFAAGGATLALAACTSRTAPTDSSPRTGTGTPTRPPAQTFTFGTAADPAGLDPALVLDSESYRVTRQIFQGLVGVDPLTSEPAPLLATSWQQEDDGRAYVFDLRKDVVFHDGEPFNAAAVCANFSRWYKFGPDLRGAAGPLTFLSVFKAFSDEPDRSVYASCTAIGEHRVRIQLTRRLTGFIPALALPAFGMSSPKALRAGRADQLSVERNGTALSRYSLNPVGTGPFALRSWEEGRVVLDAFDRYWGTQGSVQTAVFTTISHPDARLRALLEGRIDGYDLVSPDSVAALARQGHQLLQRDPYSVLYLGMNQAVPVVGETEFRQAVAHALDKAAILDGLFLNGTAAAPGFIPPKLGVSYDSVARYDYDPQMSRQLLQTAGYDGEPLPFYYPLNISRPYLPSPEKVYAVISRQLTAAGLNIKPVPIAWDEGYLEAVHSDNRRAFHLLGWSGSYRDPDDFIGALFGSYRDEFGYEDNQLFSKVDRARGLPDGEERIEAYQDISARLASRVPAVPLAFPVSAVAVSSRVQSYPVSPVMNEVFNHIQFRPADLGPASS
jgi:peptide/nickel transport system substrate-binding protein